MNRLWSGLVVALGALLMPSAVSAAGFDCGEATTADERAVCGNANLSERDSEMTGLWYAYSRFPMLMGAKGNRQDEASDFLARRRKCRADAPCLTKAYDDRIAQLRSQVAGSLSGIAPYFNADAGIPNSDLPAAVAPAATDYGRQCSAAGGSLGYVGNSQVLAGDIDGDEQFDYLINPQALECKGAATALCANDGCDIQLFLSRAQYAKPVSIRGGQPTMIQRDGRTDLEVSVSRFNCNAAPGTSCWAVYSWKDGKLSFSYRTGSGDSGG